MTPSLGPLRMTLVVAASLHNGIGASGTLPWRLPKDMAYFRAATSHVIDTPQDDAVMARAGLARRAVLVKNAVVMGRTTWESIPSRFRPLSDRINVVISTTMTQADLGAAASDPDTIVVPSFDAAVAFLQARRHARYTHGAGAALGHVFVIGGAAVYHYVLAHTSPAWSLDTLLVTRIFAPSTLHESCDVFLDEFRSSAQREWESDVARSCTDVLPDDERLCPDELDTRAVWRQASSDEHRTFLADAPHAANVGKLILDKGNAIQFQLWRRRDFAPAEA